LAVRRRASTGLRKRSGGTTSSTHNAALPSVAAEPVELGDDNRAGLVDLPGGLERRGELGPAVERVDGQAGYTGSLNAARAGVDYRRSGCGLPPSRALDRDQERLIQEKAELVAALRSPQQEDFVDAGLRQFCAAAKARWQACTDDDATRQFIVGHVERVIYNRYQVALVGFIPVQSASGETKLRFRIEGEIDIAAVRSNSCRKARIAHVQSSGQIDRKAIRAKPHKVLPDDGRCRKFKQTVPNDVRVDVNEVALSTI
jgi:hypothetical protein